MHQISVTLEDLYNGATRKLSVQKNSICEKCEGMSKESLKNGNWSALFDTLYPHHHLLLKVFNRRSHYFITHTPVGSCFNPIGCQAHGEQIWVQCLTQGYSGQVDSRSWDCKNLGDPLCQVSHSRPIIMIVTYQWRLQASSVYFYSFP